MTRVLQSSTIDKRLGVILLTAVCHKALSLALSNLLYSLAYTEDLIERHGVRSHLYADDTQLYDRCINSTACKIQSAIWLCF